MCLHFDSNSKPIQIKLFSINFPELVLHFFNIIVNLPSTFYNSKNYVALLIHQPLNQHQFIKVTYFTNKFFESPFTALCSQCPKSQLKQSNFNKHLHRKYEKTLSKNSHDLLESDINEH